MTYFYELGQGVTRDPEVCLGTLVCDGARVPVRRCWMICSADTRRREKVEQCVADRPREGRPSHRDEAERLVDAILTLSDAVSVLRTAGEERAVMLCRLARDLDALGDRLQSDEAARAVDELFEADTEDSVSETLHGLTDAAYCLRTAAEALQERRAVHATHARRLAEEVDHFVIDLRRTAES